MASSQLIEDPAVDVSTMQDDSAFNCDDLSFIIEDILSKRIEGDVISHADGKLDKQVCISL